MNTIKINTKTKLSELIKTYPQVRSRFLEVNPKFKILSSWRKSWNNTEVWTTSFICSNGWAWFWAFYKVAFWKWMARIFLSCENRWRGDQKVYLLVSFRTCFGIYSSKCSVDAETSSAWQYFLVIPSSGSTS